MEKNEIKKRLYKEKPAAHLEYIRKGMVHYVTLLDSENGIDSEPVRFEVPVEDMGDADFFPSMNAHLLIRYLV